MLSETIYFSASSVQNSQVEGIKKDPRNANPRSYPLSNGLAIAEGHRVGLLLFVS